MHVCTYIQLIVCMVMQTVFFRPRSASVSSVLLYQVLIDTLLKVIHPSITILKPILHTHSYFYNIYINILCRYILFLWGLMTPFLNTLDTGMYMVQGHYVAGLNVAGLNVAGPNVAFTILDPMSPDWMSPYLNVAGLNVAGLNVAPPWMSPYECRPMNVALWMSPYKLQMQRVIIELLDLT
jgi:hypothetical protein